MDIRDEILGMSDEELSRIQFTVPWQYGQGTVDEIDADGFGRPVVESLKRFANRAQLQEECWLKFNRNPHVNTSIRGMTGRLAGYGFTTSSEIFEIDEKIKETVTDPRNRLYMFWPKYVARALTEGELFLNLTPHIGGFVEVDYVDPAEITGGFEDGVFWHPNKSMMPLMYRVGTDNPRYVPSIFLAYYPELIKYVENDPAVEKSLLDAAKNSKKGFHSYIVGWDRGFLTKRTVSYLITTIEWLNHYENLKKYEIDHKKSSGSYLWVFSFEQIRDFKNWLSLTEEERKKTGITAKKVPGGSIVLPPGIKLDVRNPNLSRITDQDNDILHLVSSGLNEPEDIMTGASKGSYASIKASRGPMSDRTSDEMSYFENFLVYDFWRSVFFLSSKNGGVKPFYRVTECVDYIETKKKVAKVQEDGTVKQEDEDTVEPVYKKVKRQPHELITVSFPVSESVDYESRAKGLLGVKHGSVADVLGIAKGEIARRIGMQNYGYLRRLGDTEKRRYPETLMNIDQESIQEKTEAEPKKPQPKKGQN